MVINVSVTMVTRCTLSNSASSTDPEDEMTVHQYVGKWESVTPFAANQSAAKTNDKNTAGQTGMVMLQVRL